MIQGIPGVGFFMAEIIVKDQRKEVVMLGLLKRSKKGDCHVEIIKKIKERRLSC